MKDQILDLLGSIVSFDYNASSKDAEQKEQVKGLVIGLSIELNGQHSISVQNFDDSEDSYIISRMENFKAVQLDPYAFFENVKSGAIQVDL